MHGSTLFFDHQTSGTLDVARSNASSAGIGWIDGGMIDAAAGVHRGSARRSPGKGNENMI
jgi:hypothetical protein